MKKIVKLLTALGFVSLMVSFAGCGLKTEAELLNGTTSRGGEANGGGSSPL